MAHYESCLERHGDTHLGVDWPTREDAETLPRHARRRARRRAAPSLLDFGCGASHFYEHLIARARGHGDAGLDLSPRFVELSRSKFPGNRYYCVDILDDVG